MIKAVIFDADGMVITGLRFSERLTRDHGILTEHTAEFFKNAFPDCVVGKADLKKVLHGYLSKWGWHGTLDELLEFWFAEDHRADERFVEPISKLRAEGIKCFLATNQEKYRTAYFTNEMGLGKLFDGIISSSKVGFKKPNPKFFEAVVKVSGCHPEEILYWDDRSVNVMAASSFGFDARLYDTFENFRKLISKFV